MHVDNAREGFDGGAGCGADLEAAGDGDFDFAGGQVKDDGDAAAPAGFAGDDALEAGESAGLADEYPQAGGGEGDDRVERLDLLSGQTQAFFLAAHVDRDDERLTGIEQDRASRKISANSVTS